MDRQNYLSALGITQWRLRVSPQDVYVYTLMAADKKVAVLVFDALLKNEAEQSLVRAMTEATKRRYEGGFYPSWLPSCLDLPPVIVALGERAATLYRGMPSDPKSLRANVQSLGATSLVVTHAAATLLAEPALKAEAWQDLQLAMGLMA